MGQDFRPLRGRKGNGLYKEGNYKEAEVEYRKALIKDSLSLAGNYNLANVMMQQEDAANAELIYGKLGDTISKMPQEIDWKNNSVKVEKKNTLAPDYYHNLGNSFLAQKRYQEAVDAYKNALRRNPGDNETRENYIYAKKELSVGFLLIEKRRNMTSLYLRLTLRILNRYREVLLMK